MVNQAISITLGILLALSILWSLAKFADWRRERRLYKLALRLAPTHPWAEWDFAIGFGVVLIVAAFVTLVM